MDESDSDLSLLLDDLFFDPTSQLKDLVVRSEVKNQLESSELVITLVTRLLFRTLFGESFFDQWGHFVDRQMIPLIHHYSFWVPYPNMDCTLINLIGNHIRHVVFSDDGWYLFVGTDDQVIIMVDLSLNAIVRYWIAHEECVTGLIFRKGLLYSCSDDGTICIWTAYDQQKVRTIRDRCAAVESIALRDDGDHLVSASDDNCLRVWNVKNGECLRVMKGHQNLIKSVSFIGDRILSCGLDRTIRVWDFNQGTQIDHLTDPTEVFANQLCFNCDRTKLVCVFTGFPGSFISVFQWPDLKLASRLEYSASCVCFHPCNPHWLALGDSLDYSMSLINIENGECLKSFEIGHSSIISCLKFTPHGECLVSGSFDNTVRFWKM